MLWQRFPSPCIAKRGKGRAVPVWTSTSASSPFFSTGAAENLGAEDFSFPWQTELSQAGRSQAVGQSRYGTTFRALARAQACCWHWFCLLNYWTRATGGCANCGLCDRFERRILILVWDERANPGNSPPAWQRGRGLAAHTPRLLGHAGEQRKITVI